MKRLLALVLAMMLALSMVAMAEEATEEAAAEQVEQPAEEQTEEQAEEQPEEEAVEMIARGSMGDAVRQLQRKLNELGFDCGYVDGVFGRMTQDALTNLQTALGWEATGAISMDQLGEVLAVTAEDLPEPEVEPEVGDGVNLVWDGQFTDREKYWSDWGKPTLCEIVEIDGQSWMHLISSGTKFEGLSQAVANREGDPAVPELVAGETYTLSFKAYAAEAFDGTSFSVGVHNRALDGSGVNQEQYWMPDTAMTVEAATYSFTFTPAADGTFNVMIGTGRDGGLEAWFTDVKLEKGGVVTEWTEAPALASGE